MSGPNFSRNTQAPVTKESMLVCCGVAWMIQSSHDEKEAITRICRFLNHRQYEIDPSELGSSVQDSGFRSGGAPSP
nr:hypothetical protein [uncultured Oscillibacter sp.]